MAHEAEREFGYPAAKVFDAITQAIPLISKMSIRSSDPATGVVLATTGMSIFSWGENYTISVRELAPDARSCTSRSGSRRNFLVGESRNGTSNQFFGTLTHALGQGG